MHTKEAMAASTALPPANRVFFPIVEHRPTSLDTAALVYTPMGTVFDCFPMFPVDEEVFNKLGE